ncbi:MAG: hypothetical protein ACMG51_04705 [Ginsengibacter sp.]
MNAASDEEQTRAIIRTCFGPSCLEYVTNKHAGGTSGKKGSRYEDLFVAYKAAEVAANQVEFPGAPWPFLAGQQLNFVDDALLSSDSATEYFQLKNALSVAWGHGAKTIGDDFSKQFTLAQHRGDKNPLTHLVVSSESEQVKLSNSIPNAIMGHTKVSFFPYYKEGTINSLVVGSRDVQNILIKIVKDENAALDSMESALTLISAACMEHPGGCSVEKIIEYVHKRYPGHLRLFSIADFSSSLTKAFVDTLAEIKGLWYSLSRGYFNWSGYGTSGSFQHDCFSDQFVKFQERIVEVSPATFDDFEKLV